MIKIEAFIGSKARRGLQPRHLRFVHSPKARRGLQPRCSRLCIQPYLPNYKTLRTGLQIPSCCGSTLCSTLRRCVKPSFCPSHIAA